MVDIAITARARREINNILRYSAQIWGPEQADIYVGDLLTTIQRLKDFPGLGKAVKRHQHRRLVHEKHVIYYRFDGELVVVLRVVSVRSALRLALDDED